MDDGGGAPSKGRFGISQTAKRSRGPPEKHSKAKTTAPFQTRILQPIQGGYPAREQEYSCLISSLKNSPIESEFIISM